MKANELREMSDEQLRLTLKDLQDGLFRLRFQATTEKLEAPSEMRKARRDIARVKTIICQRELAGQIAGGASSESAAGQAGEE